MRSGLQQLDVHLQGGVAQQLGLGLDLLGHQVEYRDLQGTYVLMSGAVLGHDEYVFRFQDPDRGQGRIHNVYGQWTHLRICACSNNIILLSFARKCNTYNERGETKKT